MAFVVAWWDAPEPQDIPVKQDDSLKLGCINILSVKHISATIQIHAKTIRPYLLRMLYLTKRVKIFILLYTR